MRCVEEPYTSAEAAQRLHISPSGIRKHAERHGIGNKKGRDWYFMERDIERLREHLGKRGRPSIDSEYTIGGG